MILALVASSANVRIFGTISSKVNDRNGPVAKRLKRDTPEGRAAVEQLVWSQIHVHAHLTIDGKLKREGGTSHEPFAASLDLASVLLTE